jgi:GT2 family glycosyltransferase
MPPVVSVLIVTHDSRAHFPRLNAHLHALTTPYRLLVYDNASAPAQRPTPQDFPPHAILLQSERNLGFAAANNRLVEQADTEFVTLLNPDAFPERDWLKHLLAGAARYPHAAAFGSTQIMAQDERRYDGMGDAYHAFGFFWRGGHGAWRTAQAVAEGATFSVCAAAALYRRAVWRDLGGFDEHLFCFGEDVDLGFRLRLRGHASVQIPDAVVVHVGGGSSSASFGVYHAARNGLWLFLRNMPGPLLLLLAPLHAVSTMLFYLGSFGKPTGQAYRRGVRAGLGELARVWRARGETQAARSASLAEVARPMTWSPFAMLAKRAKIMPVVCTTNA